MPKSLIREITKVKNIEEKMPINNEKKTYYIKEKKKCKKKCTVENVLFLITNIIFEGIKCPSKL